MTIQKVGDYLIATYVSDASCSQCMDLGWEADCIGCKKARTQKVEVLQLGVGLFGNKAIVKNIKTGLLATVSISDLREVKE